MIRVTKDSYGIILLKVDDISFWTVYEDLNYNHLLQLESLSNQHTVGWFCPWYGGILWL